MTGPLPLFSPHRLWMLLILGGLSLLAYSNTFHVPFLFDDLHRIVENESIRTIWPPCAAMARTNRPFAFYTFALNYHVGQLNSWGYHATNLTIHILSCWCLFGIVRRTLLDLPNQVAAYRPLQSSRDWIAFVIAMIWSIHPLQTQAVTYVVQRLESLSGLCYLATLFFFAKGVKRDGSPVYLLLSMIVCCLGMGCKETMATAPLLVLWYDRAFVARSWDGIVAKRTWYYAGLTSSWAILAWAMLRYTGDYTSGALVVVDGLSPWRYLVNESAVIAHYLWLCIYPVDQCFYYHWKAIPDLKPLLLPFIALTTLFLASLVVAYRSPRIGFVLGAFFLLLAPTSSVVPIADLAFEHRMYLPLACVTSLIVLAWHWGIHRLSISRKARTVVQGVAVTLVATCLVGLTWSRNNVYRTSVSLWRDTVSVAPRNAPAWHNLGMAYTAVNAHQRAQEAFHKVVELEPYNALAHVSLGASYLRCNQLEPAMVELKRAVELEPDNALANWDLGQVLIAQGCPEEAAPFFRKALEVAPENWHCRIDLAGALVSIGRFDEAIAQSRRVLEMNVNSAEAHLNLACALGGLGRTHEAISHCRTAIAIDDRFPNAYGTLALLLQPTDLESAKQLLAKAAALEHNSAVYDIALGNLLAAESPCKAIQYYQSGVEKAPDNVEAHLGIAAVCERNANIEESITHLEIAAKLVPNWRALQSHITRLKKQIKQKKISEHQPFRN